MDQINQKMDQNKPKNYHSCVKIKSMQLFKLCATQHNQRKILVLSLSRILRLTAQAHPLPTVGRVQRQPEGRGMGADAYRGRW